MELLNKSMKIQGGTEKVLNPTKTRFQNKF